MKIITVICAKCGKIVQKEMANNHPDTARYCNATCRKAMQRKRNKHKKAASIPRPTTFNPMLVIRNCPTPWKRLAFESLNEVDRWVQHNNIDYLRPYPCSCGLWHMSSRGAKGNPEYLERHRNDML